MPLANQYTSVENSIRTPHVQILDAVQQNLSSSKSPVLTIKFLNPTRNFLSLSAPIHQLSVSLFSQPASQ